MLPFTTIPAYILVQWLLGVVIMLAGNELLLRGSVSLVHRRSERYPFLFRLLTITGLTSAAWVMTLQAGVTGSPMLALGVAAGGALAIVTLLLGILLMRASVPPPQALAPQIATWAAMFALAALLCRDGELGRLDGLALLAAGLTYGLFIPADISSIRSKTSDCSWCAVSYVFIGLALLFTGADIALDGTLLLARQLKTSELALGATLLACAMSVPELAAILMARRREQSALEWSWDVSLFRVTMGLGLTAILAPLPVPSGLPQALLWLPVACGLIWLLLIKWRKALGFYEFAGFLALFLGYSIVLLIF